MYAEAAFYIKTEFWWQQAGSDAKALEFHLSASIQVNSSFNSPLPSQCSRFLNGVTTLEQLPSWSVRTT